VKPIVRCAADGFGTAVLIHDAALICFGLLIDFDGITDAA
jgi:hypothetical protein